MLSVLVLWTKISALQIMSSTFSFGNGFAKWKKNIIIIIIIILGLPGKQPNKHTDIK